MLSAPVPFLCKPGFQTRAATGTTGILGFFHLEKCNRHTQGMRDAGNASLAPALAITITLNPCFPSLIHANICKE